MQLDVTDQASIDAFAKELASETDHVDVLINNAGLQQQLECGSFMPVSSAHTRS